ncbi:hypothetical protein MBAV_004154 [Candidatus Magnetobacterium bavaricum]|uniref:Uncharacterized protein n=1 Tax=Candidatus Magnetobacterium bavaricum TaxID=29290 RepID=A0A0F3GNU2_9BACT|nr:hypothetical protein MBAV_004154 [Candidatus Magnetobacterium bavaricum]
MQKCVQNAITPRPTETVDFPNFTQTHCTQKNTHSLTPPTPQPTHVKFCSRAGFVM